MKKSKYYTSTQTYTDLDGQSKSFTFVDHDVKLKTGFNYETPFNEEWNQLEELARKNPEVTEKYFQENDISWDNINLSHLRKIIYRINNLEV